MGQHSQQYESPQAGAGRLPSNPAPTILFPGCLRLLQASQFMSESHMQVVNPAGAVLPRETPDPQLPTAGNSQFIGERNLP